MSTAATLVNEAKRYLYGPTREQKNQLATAVDASETTFTFTHELNFTEGAVLAFDLELVYVWSTNTATNTAVVQRGWDGTTAAAHVIDSIVSVNPSFSDFAVFQAINADLADLSSPSNGLFQMKTVELTYNSAVRGYDMVSVTDVLDVYEIRYDDSGPAKAWPEVKSWTLKRNSETDDFTSGLAIVTNNAARSGAQLRVLYKAPYTQLSTLADDVQTVAGLSLHADDIPPLGAAYRLSAVREVSRNFYESQGDTRRAEEVPAGSQLRAASGLAALRMQRIQAEAARLNQAFPSRKRGR